MSLTRETKTEIRQIKCLWFVKNLEMNDCQVVHAPSELGALDKLFPGGSEVQEVQAPETSPESAKSYYVTIPKTFHSPQIKSVPVLVYPVLAVV